MKVAVFDDFAYVCPYFTNEPWVNNGYGCKHPKQDEMREDDNGEKCGACYCWSCPIGFEANTEDLTDKDIDWNGLCEGESEVSESEYIIVNVGTEASEDENVAWNNYERYINRYNPEWKGTEVQG